MDLEAAARELYALPAADFAARRTELSKQARAEGAKADAAAIAKLRKPVQSAALVNALVRSAPPELAELRELSQALRAAHRELRGSDLRELSGRRAELLNRLTELIRDRAETVTEPVLQQVRATFEAAVADAEAEEAVLSGQLTAALSYSGFGEVDLSDAVALPGRHLHAVPDTVDEPKPQPQHKKATDKKPTDKKATDKKATDERRRAAARRERVVQAAEQAAADLAEAETDRDAADADLATATTRVTDASSDVERLQAELERAQDALTESQRQQRAAERHADAAARSLRRAEQAAEAAQAALAEPS